jgi:ribosomal protein L28
MLQWRRNGTNFTFTYAWLIFVSCPDKFVCCKRGHHVCQSIAAQVSGELCQVQAEADQKDWRRAEFSSFQQGQRRYVVRADLACVVVCYYRSGLPLLCTGLYHGKDIRSGHSISFSHKKTKRKFYPNVINKRVYSECLDQYIRFRMTTTALKAIDSYGGIDKYMLDLDEVSVTDSTHNSRVRDLIASTLFHQGKLADRHIRRFGYAKEAPMKPEEILAARFKPQPFNPKRPNTAPLTPVLKSSE